MALGIARGFRVGSWRRRRRWVASLDGFAGRRRWAASLGGVALGGSLASRRAKPNKNNGKFN